ncbi:MAG TPA: TadE/TadG family type IV pilus assembly protein [Gemmataceae bacterium]|jgi:Flp pilus assembly protein TadG|nr:TadE/TadG family type IV pilus assembly protein [Gemmataceae bacterium]
MLDMKGNRKIQARSWRRAAATVEFALIAPFLGMILMGMFELGRAMMVKTILSDAARKACRTGIQRDKGNSDIVADATNVMTDNGFGSSLFSPGSIGSVNITVTDPSGNVLAESLDAPSGSVVSVQVCIPVSSTAWVAPFYLGSGSTLESETVVMMKQ